MTQLHIAPAAWCLAFLPGILLAFFGWWRTRRAWRRYSEVATRRGLTGARVARVLLDRNGMANVELYEAGRAGGDQYDPRRRCLFLSPPVAQGSSVAAVAMVARVVAQARQFRQEHRLFRLRMAALRSTGAVTHIALLLVVVGLVDPSARARFLLVAGAGLYLAFLAVHLYTLTVEYEAADIARKELLRNGIIEESEGRDFSRMLGAAAWGDMPHLLAVVPGLGWVGGA